MALNLWQNVGKTNNDINNESRKGLELWHLVTIKWNKNYSKISNELITKATAAENKISMISSWILT